MKIVCISDTHSLHSSIKVPPGEVLLFGGDLCNKGTHGEVEAFDKWLGTLPHTHKIIIAGNHDWPFYRQNKYARMWIKNATYLQDSGVTVAGLKIYGSPWQPEFFDWAFNLPRGPALAEKWAQIPDDTDLLITHGPPLGRLDRTDRGEDTGCVDLLARVQEIRPRLHLFGHIHEAYGQLEKDGIHYVNACCCDLRYRPVNPPIVVEI